MGVDPGTFLRRDDKDGWYRLLEDGRELAAGDPLEVYDVGTRSWVEGTVEEPRDGEFIFSRQLSLIPGTPTLGEIADLPAPVRVPR